MASTDNQLPGIHSGVSPNGEALPGKDGSGDQTERHLAVLAELRDMCRDAALALKTRVICAAAEGKTDDKAAKSLALVVKTAQQVIMLHQEIDGLRKKRRDSLVAYRKAQAKQIVRETIDRPDPPGIPAQQQRTEKVRVVQRVTLDHIFQTVDDDVVEGLSVAELVARACSLVGFDPGPLPPWPEWAELRPKARPEPPAGPPAQPAKAQSAKAQPAIPAHLSGASALGLNGRAPPVSPLAGPRERGPP